MGRIKVELEKKKNRLSVTITDQNFKDFEYFDVKNKSKLIQWLLENHFKSLECKKDG